MLANWMMLSFKQDFVVFFFSLYIVCVCMCARVVCKCIYVHVCDGQRRISGVIPVLLFAFIFIYLFVVCLINETESPHMNIPSWPGMHYVSEASFKLPEICFCFPSRRGGRGHIFLVLFLMFGISGRQ